MRTFVVCATFALLTGIHASARAEPPSPATSKASLHDACDKGQLDACQLFGTRSEGDGEFDEAARAYGRVCDQPTGTDQRLTACGHLLTLVKGDHVPPTRRVTTLNHACFGGVAEACRMAEGDVYKEYESASSAAERAALEELAKLLVARAKEADRPLANPQPATEANPTDDPEAKPKDESAGDASGSDRAGADGDDGDDGDVGDQRDATATAAPTPEDERPTPVSELELGPHQIPEDERLSGVTPIQVTLFAPASLEFWWQKPDIAGVDVGVFYEHVRRVHGLAVGVGYHDVKLGVEGVQIGGIISYAGGHLDGLQIGGLYSRIDGDGVALQIGGFKAVNSGVQAGGLQIAGLKTEALSDYYGIQIAGLVNESSGRERIGLEAGLINWNDTESTGGLEAGVGNWNSGDFAGASFGVANMALGTRRDARFPSHGDASGIQAGLVNIGTGWVRGVQIGLLNMASTLTGVQIGLVNVVMENGALPFMLGINPGFAGSRPGGQ